MVHYGGAEPADGAIVDEVVAEGDAAVGPLLAALESDTQADPLHLQPERASIRPDPVIEAVYAALQRLLKTERFMDDMSDYTEMKTAEGRKRLAAAARALWEKNRAVPLVERWYRTLRDDSAGPARWLEAATGLVQPPGRGAPFTGVLHREEAGAAAAQGVDGRAAPQAAPPQRLGVAGPSLPGDRRDRRGPDDPRRQTCSEACDLALRFTWWDEAGSLPTIKALMTTCRERSLDPEQASQSGGLRPLHRRSSRSSARGPATARPSTSTPRGSGRSSRRRSSYSWREVLEPLWTYPEHPAMSEAARAMFLDPKSPWLPLIPVKEGRHDHQYMDQIASPLACVPAYREALLAALADTDEGRDGRATAEGRGPVHARVGSERWFQRRPCSRSRGQAGGRSPDPHVRLCRLEALGRSTAPRNAG